jgi:hypothetical protein
MKPAVSKYTSNPFPATAGVFKSRTVEETSRRGRRTGEKYYRENEKMIAVAVETGDELRAGKPQVLFEMERDKPGPRRSYGISPDGRFVMIQPLPASTSKQIQVVLNWFDELKQLVPVN